jgi:hypothetical protein
MTTIEQLRAALSAHAELNREDNRVPTVAYRDITVDKYPTRPLPHAELHRNPQDSLLP